MRRKWSEEKHTRRHITFIKHRRNSKGLQERAMTTREALRSSPLKCRFSSSRAKKLLLLLAVLSVLRFENGQAERVGGSEEACNLPEPPCPGAEVIITLSGIQHFTTPNASYSCTFLFGNNFSTNRSSSDATSTLRPSGFEVRCPLPEEAGHVVSILLWEDVISVATSSEYQWRLIGEFKVSMDILEPSFQACKSSGKGSAGTAHDVHKHSLLPDWTFYAAGGVAALIAAIMLGVAIAVLDKRRRRRRQPLLHIDLESR